MNADKLKSKGIENNTTSKSKNLELNNVKKVKVKTKFKINYKKVISPNFKYLELMSLDFKKKYVEDRIKEVKNLPDFVSMWNKEMENFLKKLYIIFVGNFLYLTRKELILYWTRVK